MKKYTEEEIIHHLQSDLGSAEREQGAAMLLEQYAGLLWSVCARRLQNTEDIKECVNSTFAQVCLHPEKYDAQKGSLKNYLCMVADRKAIDHYHENVRRQQAEEKFARETEMGSMAVADGFPSGNDRAADKLEEALVQLAPIDSQILRMKYYDDMTYQEIAHQLGLTEGTVKMRSLRSRKKLFKILIVVLILALAAACAVVAMRRYQYSKRGGFVWSEEPLMYEMVSDPHSWQVDLVENTIYDAYFVITDEETLEGELTVCIRSLWMGDTEGDVYPVFASRVIPQLHQLYSGDGTHFVTLAGWYYDRDGFQFERPLYEVEKWIRLSLNTRGQDRITLPLYLGEEWITDLVLEPADMMDYEEPDESITLFNGNEWRLGPAYAGDMSAILSFYGDNDEETALTSQLYASKYGNTGKQYDTITLTASDGTVHDVTRVKHSDGFDWEMNQFDLHFYGVGPGEYQLHIPVLCYVRDWTTPEWILPVPEEEAVMLSCDETVLFSDGSGFHITGITKQKYEFIQYHQYAGSDELVEEKQLFWEYVLNYERISSEEISLQMADLQWVDDPAAAYMSIPGEGQVGIQIPQEVELTELRLQWIDPEYVVAHDFWMDVTVQEAP